MNQRHDFQSFSFAYIWLALGGALLVLLTLGSTIGSDEADTFEAPASVPDLASPSPVDSPIPVAAPNVTNGTDLNTILQLRQELGIRPLAGTSLDSAEDGTIFAETLGRVLRRDQDDKADLPAVEARPKRENRAQRHQTSVEALVANLRQTATLLDDHAALLEQSGDYSSSDKLRRLSRRNVKAARSLMPLPDKGR